MRRMTTPRRQRRGDGLLPHAQDDNATPVEGREEMLRSLESMLERIRHGATRGLSHAAARCRDQLRADPHNLHLILDLGVAYARKRHWGQCANVMLRGWKRVEEFKQHEVRCHFLIILCQALLAGGKVRQAMAVLGDIKYPAEDLTAKRVEALRCQAYCSNGDAFAGLKAFRKAIHGQDFDFVLCIWGICYTALQQVGACGLARTAVEALATDEAMNKRIHLTEVVASMTERRTQDDQARSKVWLSWLITLACFLAIVCYWLHGLESRNLQRLKIRP